MSKGFKKTSLNALQEIQGVPFLLNVLVLFLIARGNADCEIIIVAARHRDLIEGMKRIYDTLVSMRYLKASDIQYPSHISPKSSLALQKLKAAGFTGEGSYLRSLS